MRPKRQASHASRDRWLVSYADFITLLFAFFTTMYAISTVDAVKLRSIARGLQSAFAAQAAGAGAGQPVMSGVLSGDKGLLDNHSVDVAQQLATELADELKAGQFELSRDPRGLVLSLPEAGSFPIGSADLTPAAEGALERLGVALAKLPNAVRIEGHTDDVPIHTARFTSNWDLSTARAVRVVELFIERVGLSPDRLSAAGYAEYHPRASNDSPAARARNRRVDIIVLTPEVAHLEEPASKGHQP
jgi:chemotaxis protein MotB